MVFKLVFRYTVLEQLDRCGLQDSRMRQSNIDFLWIMIIIFVFIIANSKFLQQSRGTSVFTGAYPKQMVDGV